MVITESWSQVSNEELRLREDREKIKYWKRWGPYVSERQWATVREDYSADGDAWSYFTHDDARSRTYRWGEDGIAGVCDSHGRQNIAFAFWNGKDKFLKERLFGLSNPQGNHGESIKEAHFHVDNTPTHSYMKFLYKYPQNEFPYEDLIAENARRGKQEPEYQLLDTGIFEDDKYWDIEIEFAKDTDDPEEMVFRVIAFNRGPEPAELHILPHVWFRNTWSWGITEESNAAKPNARYFKDKTDEPICPGVGRAEITCPDIGRRYVLFSPSPGVKQKAQKEPSLQNSTEGPENPTDDVVPKMLFTENETNTKRLYNFDNKQPYVKDAFHRYVVNGEEEAVNPAQQGTKLAAWYQFTEDGGVRPGECAVVRFRLSKNGDIREEEEAEIDDLISLRLNEANEFYESLIPHSMPYEMRQIQRKAFSGMMWTKQHYHFVWKEWANGDATNPSPPESRKNIRNQNWRHMHCDDILSMPDSWEYPFFAAWDSAFHCIVLAMIDPEFAKKQLDLFTREWYCHPNGQIPAYEWNFSDVNPPVHAWATFRVFKIERKMYERQDLDFLERVFQKLLLNFTWWVNRKDVDGKNVFEGGFLGLDNIGLFNRSEPLPTGGVLEQADSSGWMAFYCLSMLNIALELAKHRTIYEDIANKFFEHFIMISDAMTFRAGQAGETSLWNDEDGFYYDAISWGAPWVKQLPVRSLVGLIPLYATLTLEPELIEKLPAFKKRIEWFTKNRCDLAERNMASIAKRGNQNRILLSIVSKDRLSKILKRMLDENEFFSDHGIRSLSKFHQANPVTMEVNGQTFGVSYVPGDSDSGLFGGNSNWRGPIWLCVNFLLIESLQRFHLFYGSDFRVDCMSTKEGRNKKVLESMHLGQVADELRRRLLSIFLRDENGRRSTNGGNSILDFDKHWSEHIWFYEFFDGDTGRGLGACHQTGWTGLVARLIHDSCAALPMTPKTTDQAMSHYFDDTVHRHLPKSHTELQRVSSSRSLGARSDFDNEPSSKSGMREDQNSCISVSKTIKNAVPREPPSNNAEGNLDRDTFSNHTANGNGIYVDNSTDTYAGNSAGNCGNVYVGNSTGAYAGNTAGNSAGVHVDNSTGTYADNTAGNCGNVYVGNSTGTYAGTTAGNSEGVHVDNSTGTYASNSAGNAADVHVGNPSETYPDNTADAYAGTTAGNSAGVHVDNSTGTYADNTADAYAGNSAGNSAGVHVDNPSGTYAGNSADAYAGNSAGNSTGTYASNSAGTYAGNSTNIYTNGSTANGNDVVIATDEVVVGGDSSSLFVGSGISTNGNFTIADRTGLNRQTSGLSINTTKKTSMFEVGPED
ncbi:hypothetical protein HOO65_010298 [Ceratocystis lukuohia]|uniref:Mannosyl-oligosaccharide glucosidase n=1 Tax=Ceratocystis lukuohia TaxID=2019550 RepID=A0ABR4MRQ8_9PEZI